jgi:hypothetical protein
MGQQSVGSGGVRASYLGRERTGSLIRLLIQELGEERVLAFPHQIRWRIPT